jgi:hypothetical protein
MTEKVYGVIQASKHGDDYEVMAVFTNEKERDAYFEAFTPTSYVMEKGKAEIPLNPPMTDLNRHSYLIKICKDGSVYKRERIHVNIGLSDSHVIGFNGFHRYWATDNDKERLTCMYWVKETTDEMAAVREAIKAQKKVIHVWGNTLEAERILRGDER